MMLSPHFSFQELTLSQTAIRRDIPNEPSEQAITNLKALCENILEPLRSLISRPIHITSGYRSPMLNQAIGGARNSYHCHGMAADIFVNGLTTEELYQLIKASDLPYLQNINEFGRWVHISYNGDPRRDNLRATIAEDGHTVYAHD